MGHPRPEVRFAAVDDSVATAAHSALAALSAHSGGSIRMDVDPALASLLKDFLATLVDSGAVAFGALEAELSPEQAGKILGVSRPLVVQRMEDGRLPFHYVGSHRRCRLKDVFALKAAEGDRHEAMVGIYSDLMDADDDAPAS